MEPLCREVSLAKTLGTFQIFGIGVLFLLDGSMGEEDHSAGIEKTIKPRLALFDSINTIFLMPEFPLACLAYHGQQ